MNYNSLYLEPNLVMILYIGIVPIVGSETNIIGILYNGLTSHMEIEVSESGRMNSKL